MTKIDESLFSLANIHQQYIDCRRHKRNTANALRFEARQEMNLLALRDAPLSPDRFALRPAGRRTDR